MSGDPRLLRTPLRPFTDDRAEIRGRFPPLVRVGTWARWAAGDAPSLETSFLGMPTALALELPYTIVPFHAQTAGNLRWTPLMRPVASPAPEPMWRGIPCVWGQALLWFRNDLRPALHPDAWMPFTVLGLFPDRDPPGPTPPHILLGTQFFLHHSRLRLSLRYGEIEYEPVTRRPRAFSDCGGIVA